MFPCLFFLSAILLQCYDSPLHFLSAFLSFSSMWVGLFWINMVIAAELSLYTFPQSLKAYYLGWGCFYPQHFLLLGTNFREVPAFNCKTSAISIPSCRLEFSTLQRDCLFLFYLLASGNKHTRISIVFSRNFPLSHRSNVSDISFKTICFLQSINTLIKM